MAQVKKAYYFSHDCNARMDEKMLAVRMKHGVEGYGVYFMLIERLAEATNHALSKDYDVIAFDFRCTTEVVQAVVENFGLFSFTDSGEFYSESLLRRMAEVDEVRERRREAGRKGGNNKASNAKEISSNASDLLEKNVAMLEESASIATKNSSNAKEISSSASDLLEKNVAKEKKEKEKKRNNNNVSNETYSSGGSEPPDDALDAEENDNINYSLLIDYWNTKTGGKCGRLESIENNRRRLVRARIISHGKRKFQEAIDKAATSNFLMGSTWFNFDWFIRPNNFDKIITGNYDNKNNEPTAATADPKKTVTKPPSGEFTADF